MILPEGVGNREWLAKCLFPCYSVALITCHLSLRNLRYHMPTCIYRDPPCWLHIEEFLFNTWGAVRKHFWGCMRHAGKENLVLPSWFLLLSCIQPFPVNFICEAKCIYTGRTGDSLLAFIFSSSHVGWNCFYKLTCSNLALCFWWRSLISMEMWMGHSLC